MIGRLARSAATVGIAGALVFAVPVQAQALLDPITTGAYVVGAVRAAAPVEAAAGVIGPEGTMLVTSAVILGALAYATRDTWMPWVSGLLGKGGATAAGTAGPYPLNMAFDPSWLYNTMSFQAGFGSVSSAVTVEVHYGAHADQSVVQGLYQCKSLGGVLGAVIPWSAGLTYVANTTQTVGSPWCPVGSYINYAYAVQQANWTGQISNYVQFGQSFDPHLDSTYSVYANCALADGTPAGTISAATANPGAGGLLVPSCAAVYGAGAYATGYTLSGGQTGTTPRTLSTYPLPTTAQTAVLYPNCVGVGAIACTYIVRYLGTPCVVGQAECVNWTLREMSHPSDYSCYYGPYALASVAKCAIDERVYEVNGTRLTQKNTDGDPWTYDSPAPAGMPELQPAPGTGAVPGTGTGTVPGGSTGTLPSPTGVPGTNGDCWSGGAFSWNPVDWVLTPIKCGLSWAFVPKTATLTTLAATAKTNLTTQGIGPIVNAVNVNVQKVGAGSGCDGPAVTFAAVGITKALHPFSACTAPMSTLAGISYAMTTVVVVLGGGFVAVKAVGAGFGFNFSMRRGGGDAA